MSQKLNAAKRWLPGALVSIVLIGAILYFVDFREMAQSIRSANYLILAFALPLSFIWMAVRGMVWRTLLRDRASYRDVLLTVGEGYLLNNFLPFRLGEIGRAFLLSRKSDMQFMEILPTIVIERAVDLAYSAAILLIALPFVVGAEGAGQIGVIVAVVVLIGLIVLYMLARKRQWALDLFHKLSQRWPALQRIGGGFIEAFLEGLAVLTDGWLFARFLFWMTINWSIAVASYYLIIRAFFPDVQVIWSFFGLGVAAFGNAIPSLPGAIGTFEGAFGGALALLTGDQSTALAAALAGRLYMYISAITYGSIGLASEGQTLSGIYQQLKDFRARDRAGVE
ncbi:MAG: lysylphosphatidylglycerol synthase transmembrane domain-containing protein [Anaerolineales bacterium]